MFVALGADHAGFELKEAVKRALDAKGVAWRDYGTSSAAPVDYPDFAKVVAQAVAGGEADRGILLCGSGVGMAITANKVPGVRAAALEDVDATRLAREHNDVNVLALAGRRLSTADAGAIIGTFLDTPFAGGRHERRLEKIRVLEHESLAVQKA